MPTPTGALTAQEAGLLALRAGWKDADATTAVAIGLVESGLDPKATNFNSRTGDLSYGWLQVNMIGKIGDERRKKYGISNNEQLLNPAFNAQVAYKIWVDAGRSFSPWSTFKNKTYLSQMGVARFGVVAAKQNGTTPWYKPFTELEFDSGFEIPGTGAVKDAASAIGDLGSTVENIGGFITNKENWFRVAAIAGGGILLILAVMLLITDTLVGQLTRKVIRSAGKAVPK